MAFPPKKGSKTVPPGIKNSGTMTPVAKGNSVFKPGAKAAPGFLGTNNKTDKPAPPFAAKGKSKGKSASKSSTSSKKMCGPCTAKGASSCSHM